MSVPKSRRKESQFEVFHHLAHMRKEITDLLLRDFGYDKVKSEKAQVKHLCGRAIEDLDEHDRDIYDKRCARDAAFHEWFILDERKAITDCLRQITSCVYMANNIYSMYPHELIERRLHQDRAIGYCFGLVQELQYAIETLPVKMDIYMRTAELVLTEIKLIKGWRKSDNRFIKNVKWTDCKSCPLRAASDSSANFANVNSNGNANYNNASNSNGVRPDFDTRN